MLSVTVLSELEVLRVCSSSEVLAFLKIVESVSLIASIWAVFVGLYCLAQNGFLHTQDIFILASCRTTKYNTIIYTTVIHFAGLRNGCKRLKASAYFVGRVLSFGRRKLWRIFSKQLKDDLLMPGNEVNHGSSIHTACKVVTDALW